MIDFIQKTLLAMFETTLFIIYFNLLLQRIEKLHANRMVWYVSYFIFQLITYFIDFPFFSTSYFYLFFAFVIGYFFFYGHATLKLTLACIFVMVNYACKLLSAVIYMSIFNEQFVNPFTYVLNSYAQFFSCFIMAIVLIIIKYLKKAFFHNIVLNFVVYILMPLTILYLTMNILTSKNSLILCFYVSISLFLSTFLLMYLCIQIMSTNDQQLENSIMHDKLKLQTQYYNDMEQYNMSISRYRHDISNHFTILFGILEKNDIHGAKQYLQKINSSLNSVTYLFNTGNSVVNIILNSKIAFAKTHNIKFDFDIVIPPTMNIDDTSLSVILFNVLDNAIEASMKLENDEDKIIKINMHIYKNMLFISVSNKYSGKILSDKVKIVSTKENNLLHGYGLKNIEYIVEKHSGNMSVNYNNNEFVISITLPLE